MKTLLYTLTVICALTLGGVAKADHNKNCKQIHGKVTVVSEDSIALDDKTYKVGDTTRVTKAGEKSKLSEVKVGDIVCVDTRGKSDIDGQVAAVEVLGPDDGEAVIKEKETTKETTKETEKSKEQTKEK